jgi:ankyrin repeat protein
MSEEDNTIQVSLVGLALTKETIVQACTSGDTSSAVDLLTKNKDLCSEQLIWFDSDGQELSTPPMFICIDYGHTETVEKLLPSHKDILNTLKDGDGDYSLVGWASFAGKLDIVKMLVEAGAKADEEALSLAREENHNQVAEYLLKQVDLYADLEGDSDAIMEKACREGDSSKVRELLEEGNYNINKWKDDDGKYLAFSPMFLAVKNGHMEVIQLFAEKGMNMEDLDAIPEASE